MPNYTEAILALLQQHPEGINNALLTTAIPSITLEQIVTAINHLSAQSLIEILKSPEDETLWYRKLQPPTATTSTTTNTASATTNSTSTPPQTTAPPTDPDERMIWQVIKNTHNKGAWTKDIKVKTGLHQNIVNKLLKTLEARQIIKAVKTKNSTRKVYMLWEVEPSLEITGGPWFSENELDVEFIEGLGKACLNFIASKSLLSQNPSLEQVHSFVALSGITSVDLAVGDIEGIVDTLVWDGKVEKIGTGAGPCYRLNKAPLSKSALAAIPCGLCPLALGKCSLYGGPVTPSKCEYYDSWLS